MQIGIFKINNHQLAGAKTKFSEQKPRIIYCTPILAFYELLVFSTAVYTLRNATVTSTCSLMFGDLATKVALGIEYRIGRACSCAKKPYSLGRTTCTNQKQL